jgi:hypothetical protein
MKLRSDSPFKNLSQEKKEYILEFHGSMDLADLAEELLHETPPVECSVPALKRFIRRLKEEGLLEEAEEGADVMEKFAERAKDSKAMDGTIEATRQRLFEQALETDDKETLMEMFKAMNEEKVRARMVAVEERKARVAEENAKLGWRKLELQAAQSALKLFPAIRETLMDGSTSAEERVRRALECMMKGGALLLENGAKG